MKNISIGIWAVAYIAMCGSCFAAGLQAQCGAEAGKGYAAEQGLVSAGKGRWYDDTMRGETIIRIDSATGDVDLRFKDATGVWQSATDQGGSVALFNSQSDPSSIMVVARYPFAMEILTLAEFKGTGPNATATLIHAASKNMPQITNARVMVATCRVSRF